jgi:hypothetical protein
MSEKDWDDGALLQSVNAGSELLVDLRGALPGGAMKALGLAVALALLSTCRREQERPGETAAARLALRGWLSAQGVELLLERDGGSLAGFYRKEPRGVPIELHGEMMSRDRGRLHELAENGARIDFELVGDGGIQGTLAAREGGLARLAAQRVHPDAHDFDRGFAGKLGDSVRVRVQLAKRGAALSGLLRSADGEDELSLAGTIDPATGAFSLVELERSGRHTGQWEGVLLAPDLAAGRFTSADGKRSLPFVLEEAQAMPPVVEWAGGVRLVPRHEYRRIPPNCTSDLGWPEFAGMAAGEVQARLNGLLRDKAFEVEEVAEVCERDAPDQPLEERATWRAGPHAGRSIALELERYAFTGGAHGSATAECVVADLIDGRLVSPRELVNDEAALAKLVTAKFRAKLGKDLIKVGFHSNTVSLDRADLCLRESGVLVRFPAYALGAHSLGTPAVELTAREARPLLRSDPAVDALLR